MKILSFVRTGVIALMATSCQQKSAAIHDEIEVRWATFNIRYDNPKDSLNNWRYRRDSVAAYVTYMNLDVVGMQEVLHHQLEDLKALLPDYAAVGVGREDGKEQGEYAPLLYRKDHFELLDSNTFWLSQYPDSAGFVGWDGACTRIATWAKLRDKETGKVFMAVNTHFDHVGVEARRNAALLIIGKIKEIVGDKPAVVTGDFNVDDHSEAYATITTNEFVLRDAFKVADHVVAPVSYTFHDFGREASDNRKKIDFVFVTEGISVEEAGITQEAEGPTGYLSDHNPHYAVLHF